MLSRGSADLKGLKLGRSSLGRGDLLALGLVNSSPVEEGGDVVNALGLVLRFEEGLSGGKIVSLSLGLGMAISLEGLGDKVELKPAEVLPLSLVLMEEVELNDPVEVPLGGGVDDSDSDTLSLGEVDGEIVKVAEPL